MAETPKRPTLYGVMAEFAGPGEVVAAADAAAAAGYKCMDAYTPFPVEGVAQALRRHRTWIPLVFLLGGITGGGGGYLMELYSMKYDYPLNVGGRPLNSWPSFIPVTFELTILIAALSGVVSLFIATRLPRLNHPVFNVPGFERATVDRFFLCIKSADPRFELDSARSFLGGLNPLRVVDVEGSSR